MKLALALAVAFAVLMVPTAGANGFTYTISGVVGDNGWYRSTVVVHVTAAGSGCPTTPFDVTFNTSTDNFSCGSAGSGFLTLQFKIDPDPPVVTGATADRPPDSNGWYTHPVNITFTGSDGNSGLASCTGGSFGGPDSATASATGTCRDNAGNVSAAGSFPLKYDATPPTIAATPARPPNAQGWYSKPVSVTFAGTDPTSGIASCTPPVRYKGPDNAAVTLKGSCTDQAGNSASATFALKYDSTPPHVSDVATSAAGDAVTVSWQRSKDTTIATVLRSPGRGKQKVSAVYRGPATRFRDASVKPGVMYHYTVATTDAAGNDARVKVAASLQSLYAPAPGARVKSGAMLAWTASAGASYYNVQLFRNGAKVLSTWPVRAQFKLPRAWTFAGRHYQLQRGSYKWYVWPGIGPRAKARYGKLLGGSTFTVR